LKEKVPKKNFSALAAPCCPGASRSVTEAPFSSESGMRHWLNPIEKQIR